MQESRIPCSRGNNCGTIQAWLVDCLAARVGVRNRDPHLLVCARIRELQETLSAGTIALEISSRNARVAALQERWDRLRAGLDLILDQRGADMADLPGDASGMLVRDCKGKEAERLVTRIELARSLSENSGRLREQRERNR